MNDTRDWSAGTLISRRHMVIGGLLACASGVAYARQPQVANPVINSDTFDNWVPARFGNWAVTSESGVVLPPPDTLRDRLYDNLVTRVYTAPGQDAVMLLLAYNNAQSGVVQVHRPEVCYPVGGFALTPTRHIDLPLANRMIPANIFTASGTERTEQVVYFTRLGSEFPRSWISQRLAVMEANLDREIPDGMMMRVSLLGGDQSTAQQSLSQFANAFYAAAPTKLRSLLTG